MLECSIGNACNQQRPWVYNIQRTQYQLKKNLERTKHQLTPSKVTQETKNTEAFIMLIDYKHNNLKHNKHYNL